jgi:hypothetical protein
VEIWNDIKDLPGDGSAVPVDGVLGLLLAAGLSGMAESAVCAGWLAVPELRGGARSVCNNVSALLAAVRYD